MRKESNAPTERIIRILEDVATLEAYVEEVNNILATRYPDDLNYFPPTPRLPDVEKERVRQTLMLKQTRGKRNYARKIAQLARDHDSTAISMKDIAEDL